MKRITLGTLGVLLAATSVRGSASAAVVTTAAGKGGGGEEDSEGAQGDALHGGSVPVRAGDGWLWM